MRRRLAGMILILVVVALSGHPLVRARAAAAQPSWPTRPRIGLESPVTAGLVEQAPAQNSPLVVVDPTDPRFAVVANRLDAPDYSCALQLSGDGGRGWVPAQPVPKLPKGAEKCYAPEVAFDRDGNLHYLFVGLAGLGNAPMGIFITTSADRGRTFSAPREILTGKSPGRRFGVRMAIDRTIGDKGRMHVIWLQATSATSLGGLPASTTNPILAAHSDDGGKTFSTPVQVSDPKRKRVVAPALTLGPDHAVHVVYYDLEDDFRDYQGLEGPPWEGTWSVLLSSSYDGGDGFGPSQVVDAEIVPTERVMLIFTMPPPSVAVGPTGAVYVAWSDGRNGDWDVLLRRSVDRGRTWSPVLRLNDDALRNGRHQYLPALSVARNGRVDAVFADRRNSASNDRNDVYFTSSTDRGRSFLPNVRLTTESSDPNVGPSYLVASSEGLKEFGGRFGLGSLEAHAIAAWTDTRNSRGGITSQEIFSSRVDRLPEGPGGAPEGPGAIPWVLGGLAVAALVMGGGVVGVRRRERSRSATTTGPAAPAS